MDDSGGNFAPPTKAEQESMAKFWAMEEANAPKGWGDEQEIDYAEISSKRTENSQNPGQLMCTACNWQLNWDVQL